MRPDYGYPYLNLGNLLFQQGLIDDAMAQWEKALGTQPHDAAFHALLGDAFLRAGSQKVAIAEYERAAQISAQDPLAVTIGPGSSRPLLMLQFAMENRAIELAKEAVRLSRGKDPNYLRTLGGCFRRERPFR